MSRSWREVKAEKEAIDQANGRDVSAVREMAHGKLKIIADFDDHDVTISTSQADRAPTCA